MILCLLTAKLLQWPAGIPLSQPVPGVFTTAWRVTVVEESDVVDVLVHRVETLVPDWKRSQAER